MPLGSHWRKESLSRSSFISYGGREKTGSRRYAYVERIWNESVQLWFTGKR